MASFDENGKYIKTNWKAGDKITATKLNKIEESIEAVNDNDISRHVEADARLDALEAKDVAHDKELTNIKNLIADNKAAAELGDYEINSRMQFLENELNEGIEEVHNVASTVDGKIATAEANMAAQVNQGKADMEAMVAEVEADLEGLHAKDEKLEKLTFVNIKDFGAVGDGVTDDLVSINNAIEYAHINHIPIVIFPSGHYRVRGDFDGVGWDDKDYGIKVRSNIKCILADDTIVQTIPTSEFFYKVFNIHECENVEICGGTIIGDRVEGTRFNAEGTQSEFGHGISISRSKNVIIRNLTTRDHYGDGIIINTNWDDTDKVSENILIENIISDNNRRQGLSILTCKNIVVKKCKFINTNGTPPQCGIDVEPDGAAGVITENIFIDGCYFNNNSGQALWFAGSESFKKNNIYVNDCVFDCRTGINNTNLLLNRGYSNVFITNNKFLGYTYSHIATTNFSNVNILNNIFDSDADRGIWVDNRGQDGVNRAGEVNIDSNYFINQKTSIYLTVSSSGTNFNITNNTFRNHTEAPNVKSTVALGSQGENTFNVNGNLFYNTRQVSCATYGTIIQNNRFIECPKQCIVLNSQNRNNVISNNYFEDSIEDTGVPIIEILYGKCHYNVIQNNVFNSTGCTYTVYDDLGTVNAIINNVTQNAKQINVPSSDKQEGNINLQS